jgi:hypothetical protein
MLAAPDAQDLSGKVGRAEVEKIDPIALMIARFAALAERGTPAVPDLETKSTLEFIFTTLAETQTDAIDVPIAQDPMYPGHLVAKIQGRTLYIPFHLAEVLPSGDVLEFLVQQAEAVRILSDSTICLSGSAAIGLHAGSDIDFCEYVPHTGKRLAQSFLSKKTSDIPFCTDIRHGKSNVSYPWTGKDVLDLCTTDTGRVGGKCSCPHRDWKFDYVGYCATDAIPISNICIHEDDADALSWAFQEIAIVSKPQPIRYLIVPADLGKYVLWLRRQLDKFLLNRPDKALKRALSLTRLLRLTAHSDKLYSVLKNRFFAIQARRNTIPELTSAIARLPESVRSKLSYAPPDAESESLLGFSNEELQSLILETTQAYDGLMSRARKLVVGA